MKRISIILLSLLALACGKPGTEGGGGVEPATLTAPTNIVDKGVTDNSLTFQWDQVQGATSYEWKLTLEGAAFKSGTAKERHAMVDGLTAGTSYGFSVCAKNASQTSAWSAVYLASTTGKAPGPEDLALCVDAPLVVEVGTGAALGTSGLIRVFKADGTLVDKIDMADMAKMTALSDGTLVPKEQMNQETTYHTFLDALHSTRYRPVHYTPVRLNGGKLEIKLHNEVLTFGTSYYVTMDASVAGKALAKDDMPFSTKAKPSGNTLKVAADGSGDFCTVQGALSYASTLGKDTAVTIEVANGTYRELLYLRDKNKLTIKGQSRDKTIIAYPNNESYSTGSGAATSTKPSLGNAVGAMGGRGLFLVESCDQLVLENLTIENTFFAADHKGQAETLYFNADGKKLTIEKCSLISWQDTFLCKGSVWVHNSLIAGHCDYIWGYPSACLFENCEIRSRAAGYIVQARCAANSKGFVFLNCSLTAESGVADGCMYLARSGGNSAEYDNVTYVNCSMSSVIAPKGWLESPAPNPSTPTASAGWKEYGTTGVSTAQRNAYGKILTADEATAYSSRAAVLGW